ncbi:hypothetical protein [Streptomyces sp. PKU-EA00015]|uniref:hypothetical protein n=1 Tax=Streptomyces sp. PKU-EA00015 TaxID=2748326 RepID=UPI0035C86F57
MSTHDPADAHPRFAEALRELGLEDTARRFPDATLPRSPKGTGGAPIAAQAAEAIGCDVGEMLIAHAGGTVVDVRERTA